MFNIRQVIHSGMKYIMPSSLCQRELLMRKTIYICANSTLKLEHLKGATKNPLLSMRNGLLNWLRGEDLNL